MAQQIVNAAPMVIEYGTQDLSKRLVPRTPELIPQHLPKFYIFAEKGPIEPQLVSGADLVNMFGAETFAERGKFTNHSTIFVNKVNAAGNAVMLQRVIPEDAGPESNLVAWLDVLPTTIDLYERNEDGSIKLNQLGDPTVVGTTQGYKVKWIVTNRADSTSMQNFGAANIGPGDQVDPATNTQSKRYPMFELKVSSRGAHGNNVGIRLWAPTTKSVATMPVKMMNTQLAYPYFISVIKRSDSLSSPKMVESLFGEQKQMVTFKPGAIDPLTGKQLYLGDTFVDSYQNLTDLKYSKVYGDFSDLHIYQDNIDLLVGKFHAAEIPFIDGTSDFSEEANNAHLFNFLTGVGSDNSPYHSFIFVDNVNTVRFSEYTNVYAKGGSDGTLNDEVHAKLVKAQVERYLDPNDILQERAVHVESHMYDTGFPMETKYALINFIGVRKDTKVILSTYTVGGPELTPSEEHSIAVALRTRLQMFPESDYFGTPVMRGLVIGRSGKLRNSQFGKRLPLTAEIAIKSAKYMGASNGVWTNGAHFDGAPGSIVENMYDISITWVPTSVRNRNWDVGLNWVQSYDTKSFFFPALKTVYDDDTSVLNSYETICAIGEINKVVHACWREFSGVSHLTSAQLVQRTNDYVIEHTKGRFDGRFVIVPDALITDMDDLRGFSWTLPVHIYCNNMKTVMTTYVSAHRMSDLEG